MLRTRDCACGKLVCISDVHQNGEGRWACVGHPQFGYGPDESKHSMPDHHSDGSTDCETNFRTLEQQHDHEVAIANWKAAQTRLPDLSAVMEEVGEHISVMDGHSMHKFAKEDPEGAAISLIKMFEALHAIACAQSYMAELAKCVTDED